MPRVAPPPPSKTYTYRERIQHALIRLRIFIDNMGASPELASTTYASNRNVQDVAFVLLDTVGKLKDEVSKLRTELDELKKTRT